MGISHYFKNSSYELSWYKNVCLLSTFVVIRFLNLSININFLCKNENEQKYFLLYVTLLVENSRKLGGWILDLFASVSSWINNYTLPCLFTQYHLYDGSVFLHHFVAKVQTVTVWNGEALSRQMVWHLTWPHTHFFTLSILLILQRETELERERVKGCRREREKRARLTVIYSWGKYTQKCVHLVDGGFPSIFSLCCSELQSFESRPVWMNV